jgi:hypothetical protein
MMVIMGEITTKGLHIMPIIINKILIISKGSPIETRGMRESGLLQLVLDPGLALCQLGEGINLIIQRRSGALLFSLAIYRLVCPEIS